MYVKTLVDGLVDDIELFFIEGGVYSTILLTDFRGHVILWVIPSP